MSNIRRAIAHPRASGRAPLVAAGPAVIPLAVAAVAAALIASAVGHLSGGRPSALAPQPMLYAAATDKGLHIVDYGVPSKPASIGDSQLVVPASAVAASANVAYLGAGDKGLAIFDMRDPNVPSLYQALGTPRYNAARLVVDGARLYALDLAAGVRIFDVTNPYDPALKGAYHVAGQTWTALAVSGDLMVLLGADVLRTVDVRDPSKAVALGEVKGGGNDVALRGGLAYVVDGNGLSVVDVRKPKLPAVIGGDVYPQGTTLAGPRVHLAKGRGRDWAWVGGGFATNGLGALVTWDVASPRAPKPIDLARFDAAVKSLESDPDALQDDGVAHSGELLFVGTAAGLHTVAVADDSPDKPQTLGDAAGLADASIAAIVLDPRERQQATPTAQLTEAGDACVDAEADAWVSVNTRGVNHGGDVELVIAAGGQDTAESYLRFKTSFIPADADVVTASLEADLILQTGGQPPVLQAVIDAADAPWDESTLTFLNKPARSGRYGAPGIDEKAERKRIDVRALVVDWHVGKRPNHGLVISSENTTANPIDSRFGSRENPRTAPPRLCVGWTRDVTRTPAPTATDTVPPTATATQAPTRTPPPTDTATTEASATAGPTPTGEGDLPTPTPPPTSDATRRPTKTPVSTAEPTARPSATASPRPAGGGFGRPESGAPMAMHKIRRLHFGPDGELWARVPDPNGGPDIVVTRVGGRWRRWGTVEEAIEQRFAELVRKGVVPDFFAADARGRIWAGANLYDGHTWRRLATDVVTAGGTLRHEQRTLFDDSGQAWVPFEGTTECANPLGCGNTGVRAFDADRGALGSLDIDPVPEMAEYSLEGVQLVKGEAARGTPTLAASAAGADLFGRLERWLAGAIGTGGARRAATSTGATLTAATSAKTTAAALAANDAYVVSPSALYVLPDTATAIRYPFLPSIEDAGGETRNAGYATTSAIDLSGHLVAFTWIERHEGRTLSYQIVANTWLGTAWDTPLDLTPGSPLLIDGSAEFLRLSAAAFAPDGTLWLGTSDGQVAAYKDGMDGMWPHHFTSSNSPLIPLEPISALTVAPDGTLWIAQPSGLLTFGEGGLVGVPTIYLPRAQKP
ncbi:MAG: DNRLRE domain-containing protein [Ardenticatenales bacterium]